ncbi:MAG: hypothetical protein QXM37_04120 [Candidatus Bathyarchaeia archaeon]
MPSKPLSVLLVVLVLLGSLALLKPLGVDVPSVYADTVFEDGFESGDFSKWSGTIVEGTGSNCTIETLHPFSGDYNAKFYTPNSFQFPLLGFLLCIFPVAWQQCISAWTLSIPFIGIFALHLWAYFGGFVA